MWKYEARSARDRRQKLVRAIESGFLGTVYVRHTGSNIMTTAVEMEVSIAYCTIVGERTLAR
jgi:hypothetical protein